MENSLLTYVDNDLLHPFEWQRQAREFCREMRAKQPILHTQEYGWLLFRYQEASQVRFDHLNYSSELTSYTLPEASTMHVRPFGMAMMDPPRHQQMRNLVAEAFSPQAVSRLASSIGTIVNELLENIREKGEVDWIDDFAIPLPVFAIADILGLPREEWRLFKQWSNTLAGFGEDRERAEREVANYLSQLVTTRRKKPDNDLVSHLLSVTIDGNPLTQGELLDYFLGLLVPGHVNTTYVLANMLLCFHLFPQAWEQLRQNTALVENAVEEVLRFISDERVISHEPIGSRIAKGDIQLRGQTIHAGDILRPVVLSANFDEEHFPHAEQFDLKRHPNRHLSFGNGIHYCLGASLGRLELCLALEHMVKCFPSWEIVHPEALEQIASEAFFSVKHLPLRVQNG